MAFNKICNNDVYRLVNANFFLILTHALLGCGTKGRHSFGRHSIGRNMNWPRDEISNKLKGKIWIRVPNILYVHIKV